MLDQRLYCTAGASRLAAHTHTHTRARPNPGLAHALQGRHVRYSPVRALHKIPCAALAWPLGRAGFTFAFVHYPKVVGTVGQQLDSGAGKPSHPKVGILVCPWPLLMRLWCRVCDHSTSTSSRDSLGLIGRLARPLRSTSQSGCPEATCPRLAPSPPAADKQRPGAVQPTASHAPRYANSRRSPSRPVLL